MILLAVERPYLVLPTRFIHFHNPSFSTCQVLIYPSVPSQVSLLVLVAVLSFCLTFKRREPLLPSCSRVFPFHTWLSVCLVGTSSHKTSRVSLQLPGGSSFLSLTLLPPRRQLFFFGFSDIVRFFINRERNFNFLIFWRGRNKYGRPSRRYSHLGRVPGRTSSGYLLFKHKPVFIIFIDLHHPNINLHNIQ